MTTPESNTLFVNSLFSPAVGQMQRMNAQRLALAESGARRAWSLADADRDASVRRDLAALQANTQLAIAREATDRTLEREDKRTRESIERERRKSYGEYVQLGGNKALTDFQAGDEGIATIEQEAASLRLKALRAQIKAGSQFVKQRIGNLRALTDDASIQSEATNFALGKLALEATSPAAAQAISDIRAGRLDIGLSKLLPEDRAIFDGYRQQGLIALRVARYKDPAVQDALRGAREAQGGLFSLVQKAAPALSEDEATSLFGMVPDVDVELGAAPRALDFGKMFPAPATPQPAAPATVTPDPVNAGNEYGGVIGLVDTVAGAPYRFGRSVGDWTKENAQYALPALAFMAGGRKLYDQQQAAQDRAATSLSALRNRTQATVEPLESAGRTVLRALLRSVISPATEQPGDDTESDSQRSP